MGHKKPCPGNFEVVGYLLGCHVSYALNLSPVQYNTICCEHTFAEWDLWLLNIKFCRVEDKAIPPWDLHQIQEIFVLLLKGFSIYYCVILCNCNFGTVLCYLVHLHLEHILGYLKAKWLPQKMILAQVGIEGSQWRWLMVEVTRIHCGHLVWKIL